MSLSSLIAQPYLFGNGNTGRKVLINKHDLLWSCTLKDHQEDKIRKHTEAGEAAAQPG